MGKKRNFNSRVVFFLMGLFAFGIIASLALFQKAEPVIAREQRLLESELIASSPEMDNGMAVVIDGYVQKDRLMAVAEMDYNQLKSRLGVGSDFAVHFVDDDDTVVPIGSKTCIGSPKAQVGGRRCG